MSNTAQKEHERRREDEILRQMLNTPPKPRKPKKPKTEKPKSK